MPLHPRSETPLPLQYASRLTLLDCLYLRFSFGSHKPSVVNHGHFQPSPSPACSPHMVGALIPPLSLSLSWCSTSRARSRRQCPPAGLRIDLVVMVRLHLNVLVLHIIDDSQQRLLNVDGLAQCQLMRVTHDHRVLLLVQKKKGCGVV